MKNSFYLICENAPTSDVMSAVLTIVMTFIYDLLFRSQSSDYGISNSTLLLLIACLPFYQTYPSSPQSS